MPSWDGKFASTSPGSNQNMEFYSQALKAYPDQLDFKLIINAHMSKHSHIWNKINLLMDCLYLLCVGSSA